MILSLKRSWRYKITVDQAIDVVKNANVPYQVSAMETTMKGDLNQLLEIVKAAQQKCIDGGAVEVITNIKIHNKTIELDFVQSCG